MIDVVIFAVIAAVLVFKLWSQLGKRGDGESGFDTFVGNFRPDEGDKSAKDSKSGRKIATEKATDAEFSDVPPAEKIPDYAEYGNAAKGLQNIKKADPYFDPQQFLQGAEIAFETILQDYVDGNKASLKKLLNDELYKSFAAAIDARSANKETLSDTLIGVDKIAITDANLSADTASVTVTFNSQQVLARYDSGGNLIEGNEAEAENKKDIWEFQRKIKSKSPNWILSATSS